MFSCTSITRHSGVAVFIVTKSNGEVRRSNDQRNSISKATRSDEESIVASIFEYLRSINIIKIKVLNKIKVP